MKTVLHVIDTTGPGGAETIFLQLAKNMADKGYRSIALIRGNGWVQSQLEELNIPFHVINCKGSFNLGYLITIIKLIKKEKVNIIQSHLLGSNVYCSLAAIFTQARVFATFHGMVDIKPDERFKTIKLIALRLGCKKIIAVTDTLKDSIKSLPIINRSRVTTIYNGIDINRYKKIDASDFRSKLNLSDDDILIGSLGNIRQPKNYPLAIETIYKLHEKGHKVHYAVAGDGNAEQMQPLDKLIRKYDLSDYVHLLGFTRETQAFLSALNIFLMTSTSEGHPLALTQAMANGLPIVSTRCGVELIVTDNVEAILSPSMTADSLTGCIEKIINDGDLANKMGQNAFIKAQNQYALDAMFDQYMSLYQHSQEQI